MLIQSAYGKSRVRLVRVDRVPGRHVVRDLSVNIRFTGRYDESYTDGDNSAVLPTDTMKNTVYALAARDGVPGPETFGLALARHFLDGNPRLERVRIDLIEQHWDRIPASGGGRGTAFVRRGPETRTAAVQAGRRRTIVGGGVADLMILKTAGSAFDGFRRDEFTTLGETRDRLLATSLTGTWRYRHADADFDAASGAVRRALLNAFAEHESESVQHTLHAMARAALERVAEVTAVRLVMPNRHHLPVDLTPFGLENRNEIFVPTDEPYGLIEATLVR